MMDEKDFNLTPKERKFCEAYLRLGKKEAAAIEAGYAPKSAAVAASRLLKKDKILAYTRTLQAHMREELGISDDWAVLQAIEIYNRCMGKAPVTEWDYEQHKFIETGKYTFDSKGAIKALELLSKLLGLAKEDESKLSAAITIYNNVGADDGE